MTLDSSENGSRSLLSRAIEQEDWEAAALCIVYGALKALESMPAESVDELMEMLAEEPLRRRERSGKGRRHERRRRHYQD